MSSRESQPETSTMSAESTSLAASCEKSQAPLQQSSPTSLDVIIVGGGLSGALTALRLAQLKPGCKIAILEESQKLGGDLLHTWSFHDNDLSADQHAWLAPFVSHRWSEHEVLFPKFQRVFKSGYNTIRSEEFHTRVLNQLALAPDLNVSVHFGAAVVRTDQSTAVCADGRRFEATLVCDARGLAATPAVNCGFQKFIGYDLQLVEPHKLTRPILKDACCPQTDGYRFFYLLPFDEKRLLIEETFYSDSETLNAEKIDRSLRSYIERKGWKIMTLERKESGVLLIPLAKYFLREENDATGNSSPIEGKVEGKALCIGTRGRFFHATTGYSLPDAVRVADFIASQPLSQTDVISTALRKFRRADESRQGFYRLLNRLLFRACEPALRYTVLQRFYELPQDLIERFYAGQSTWLDRVRILSGRPPVPIANALRSLSQRSMLRRPIHEKEADLEFKR